MPPRVCLTLLVVIVPFGFAGFAAYTAVRWALALRWPAVPCVIQASSIREGSGDHAYFFEVRYQYAWQGGEQVGKTLREDYHGSGDVAEADRLLRAYPFGASRTCFVNPAAPAQSLLEHDNPWLPACLVPVMVAIGAVLAMPLLRRGWSIEALGCPFLLIMGLAGYILLFGQPLQAGIRSVGWRATPCVVESAQVRSQYRHSWPVGCTIHRPDVVFRYSVDGVEYRANLLNASEVGSAWYYGYRRAVRRYSPGTRTICYVNPTDPTEAVLERRLSGTQWFGVWPLLVAALGAIGTFQAIRGRPVRVGTPRLWGTLALGAATTVALHGVLIMASDLVQDASEGIAEPFEYGAVVVTGIVSAGLLLGWIALAASRKRMRGRRSLAGTPAKKSPTWDGEFDGNRRPPKRNT